QRARRSAASRGLRRRGAAWTRREWGGLLPGFLPRQPCPAGDRRPDRELRAQRVPQRQLSLPLAVVARVGRASEQGAVGAEAETYELAHRPQAVEPGQLLALGPAARVVADRHLVDPIAEPQDPAGAVGLDVNPLALEVEPATRV